MSDLENTNEASIQSLLKNGGVYFNVKGDRPEIIFKSIISKLNFPEDFDTNKLYEELCHREELMSTAVGNGIAIPHPRYPLLTNDADQKLIVCFLDKPVMMNPPDMRPVYVFFILLTSNTKTHLKMLSQLAFLFQKPEFRHSLEQKPSEEELLKEITQSLKVEA